MSINTSLLRYLTMSVLLALSACGKPTPTVQKIKPMARSLSQKKDKDFTIAELISQLRNPKKARKAAESLMKFRRTAIPALIANLKDPNLELRYYVAYILTTISDKRITAAMYERLIDDNEHPLIHTLAAKVMGFESYKPATDILIAMLARRGKRDKKTGELKPQIGDNIKFRYTVARALSSIGTPKVIPPLIKMLSSEHARIRQEAAIGLGYTQSKGALPEIVKLLEDDKPEVIEAALLAIGKYATTAFKYAPRIIKLTANTNPPKIRYTALNTLNMITGQKHRTHAAWAQWLKKRNAKTSATDENAPLGVPLPAVNATDVIKELNEQKQNSDDENNNSGGPALKLPWEETKKKKKHKKN